MNPVLVRAGNLLRRPGVLLVVIALALGGTLLIFVPLFGVPGYELGSALACGVGVLGGLVGIASARIARASGLVAGGASPWTFFAAALSVNLLVLIPPLVASVLLAWTSSHCDPFAYLGFYPLLTVPSAILASAAGCFSGFLCRRKRWAFATYALLLLLSLVASAWPLVFGPQIYAYNHFLGHLPGPLYDELLKLRPGLWWFRLETLLLAGVLLGMTWLLLTAGAGRAEPLHSRWGAIALIAVCTAGSAAIERHQIAWGIRITDQGLAEALGGVRRSDHFLLTYPRGKSSQEVERWVRDLEFRHRQLRELLGGAPLAPIRVYLYRSAEQKQRLVGAAQTQFAKPWRLELHLNDSTFPHPALKHELAHVMAAPYGQGPFRVTSRFGILPVMGVIEGLAVAADNPVEDLSLHQWAAAMRRQKLAPDIRTLFSVTSFYANPAPRAYILAGSFLRFLAETYGTEKLKRLYRRGDFSEAFDRPLNDLARQWEIFVDGIPLDTAAVDQAFARFRRASLFSRACAREVVRLAESAATSLGDNPDEALARYRRCAALQPDEPSFRLGQAVALEKLGRIDEASEELAALSRRVHSQPAQLAEALMAQADLAWRLGHRESAVGALREVLALRTSPAMDRMARIKLAAVDSPAAAAIRAYFEPGSEELRLFQLREAVGVHPTNPYLSYLLGRRLVQARAPLLALPYLSRALAEELPPSIRREAHRLKAESDYLSGDCAAVDTDVGLLPDLSLALKAEMSEWQERCQFEKASFQGPLVPNPAFR